MGAMGDASGFAPRRNVQSGAGRTVGRRYEDPNGIPLLAASVAIAFTLSRAGHWDGTGCCLLAEGR